MNGNEVTDVAITEGSGNVFIDLGFGLPRAMKLRAEGMIRTRSPTVVNTRCVASLIFIGVK
jgi:hypothetical protein